MREVLKGPPRVSSITQAPQQSLFLSGMTLSSVLSLHWVNRIIALNNYTDIPGEVRPVRDEQFFR